MHDGVLTMVILPTPGPDFAERGCAGRFFLDWNSSRRAWHSVQ
jgi:hypothetical protein